MASSIDLKSTSDVEISSIRADITTLSESISLQNDAIDNACSMALHAKNRSIDFSARVTNMGRDICDLNRRLRHLQNTCLVMAAMIAGTVVLWAFGVI